MRTRVVVLGAGFGGLELTTILSEALGETIDVVLIDKSDAFCLWVLEARRYVLGTSRRQRSGIFTATSSSQVCGFYRRRCVSIDPGARKVVTDAGEFEADFLVVALGADLDPGATPGLVEGGNEFYSVAGAFALRT